MLMPRTGKRIGDFSTAKTFLYTLFPFFLLFLSSSAFAARPLITDDAYTVEKSKLQLEAGFDFARQDNHDKELFPSLTFTYGLFERMDVGIGSAYLFVDPAEGERVNGFADTELKMKYRLIDEKDWIPFFTIAGKLKIPTASESKGLGSGKTDFGINTIVTKNLSKSWALHLNLGYTFIGEHGGDNEFHYSLAGQFVLSNKWALVGEIFGVNNFNGRKRDDPFSGLLGIQHIFNDSLIGDAGVEDWHEQGRPGFSLHHRADLAL